MAFVIAVGAKAGLVFLVLRLPVIRISVGVGIALDVSRGVIISGCALLGGCGRVQQIELVLVIEHVGGFAQTH